MSVVCESNWIQTIKVDGSYSIWRFKFDLVYVSNSSSTKKKSNFTVIVTNVILGIVDPPQNP